MDSITLTGLDVFGHHGALPHERELGQRFVVDVSLGLDLGPAAQTDDLADTVDYGRLAARITQVVAGDPCDLIEAVAGRVIEVCFADPRVEAAEVTVHKPSAPLPVVAREVSVTIKRKRP